MTDINETIAEVLRIDAQATPGPWYPQATDDRLCMNASYVSTDPKSGLRDMDPQSAERDCRPGSVVAITLLQSPRLANVRDQRWDENTDLIAYYRTAAPALAREVQRLQITVEGYEERTIALQGALEVCAKVEDLVCTCQFNSCDEEEGDQHDVECPGQVARICSDRICLLREENFNAE